MKIYILCRNDEDDLSLYHSLHLSPLEAQTWAEQQTYLPARTPWNPYVTLEINHRTDRPRGTRILESSCGYWDIYEEEV